MTNKIIFTIILINCIFQLTFSQSENQPEINVVYGDKHIFTIETPDNWINDKDAAQTIGLVCFFYSKADSLVKHKSHFYANGIDKETPDETLDKFIDEDIKTFKKKYPDLEYETFEVGFTGGVKNGKLFSFSNLTDRFKEEVLYGETESTILIFVFSAMTQSDYEKYQPVFDKFINSFNYRGNNPQPFLDYMKSKNN